MVRKYRKSTKRAPLIIAAILIILPILCGIFYYVTTMRPLLEKYVESELRNRVNLMISQITSKVIRKNNVTYTSLITLTKDSDGRIMSLSTNLQEMNSLKLDIEKEILKELLETEAIEVDVPIGSLIGGELLSGRGPCIKIKVVPMAEVYTKYDNTFDSAGINQTRHQIFIDYKIRLNLLLPGKRTGTIIESRVCIAETIIVGLIPEFFVGK